MQLRRELVAESGRNFYGQSLRRILTDFRSRILNPQLAMRFTVARMHSAMYEARSANYPKIPRTLLHLGILLGLSNHRAVCNTLDGDYIIFRGVIGNQQEQTVSVIFISGRMIQFLQGVTSIHSDGTFRKRPRKPKCSQIFNIVTRYGMTVVCIMRVLMQRRTIPAYDALFHHIKMIAPNFAPQRIHCDFERAQMNSWRYAFPNAMIVGCLWHYAVAVSNKARKLGIAQLAEENDEVYSFIRCLCAAPLLPEHLIWAGLQQIRREIEAAGYLHQLGPLLDYFEREWLPRIAELSVWDCPERTNNCSESDNRMIGNVTPMNAPNTWHLIGGFVRLEYHAWCDKLAIDDGRPVNHSRRWKTVQNDARVARYSNQLRHYEITPAQFLHRASWCILAAVNHGLRLHEDQNDSGSEDQNDSGSEDQNDSESD